MMFKALMQKKWREFQAKRVLWVLGLLLAASFLPLFRVWFDSMAATVFPAVLLALVASWMGLGCAAGSFQGDFANQVNLFLEYLPVRRSAVWFTNYLSGFVALCLAAVLLLWLELILFPHFLEMDLSRRGGVPDPDIDMSYLTYLCPNRLAAVIACGSYLFWTFSVTVFPTGYLGRKDAKTANPIGAFMMFAAVFGLPITVIVTLRILFILPSATALSPVLWTSGVLFSAGSYALFALTPKHLTRAKRDWLGLGLFLAISAALVGHLYTRYLTWRVLDPSLPVTIAKVYKPHLEGAPNLLLASLDSYRSGQHYVSLDLENAKYHDLGRGLSFLDVPMNRTGLLYFEYSTDPGGYRGSEYLRSMAPDATRMHSFRVPTNEGYGCHIARCFPEKGQLVYRAYFQERGEERARNYVCAANSNGELLKRFECDSSGPLIVNDAGQVLAMAPIADHGDATPRGPAANEPDRYMLIDLDGGDIRRFGLPGAVRCFSKDLRRVICQRTRIHNGRRFKSLVVVELPTMEERLVLPEDDLPAEEITAQVELGSTGHVGMRGGETRGTEDLVNDAFDAMLWIKHRVEGDSFRYAIVLVNLDTGKQQVVVPESAIPAIPVVVAEGSGGAPVVKGFCADGTGFTYTIGARIYLCDLKGGQPTLLADNSVRVDNVKQDGQTSSPIKSGTTAYSPSDRRVLRYMNDWQKQSDGVPKELAVLDVFQNGKPVRVFTGQRFITGAIWLDEERIVCWEDGTIYLVNADGGSPRQIFPPLETAGSLGKSTDPAAEEPNR